MEYVEQVAQGEAGLQIYVEQVEQGQGVCPAEPLHLFQSGSTRPWKIGPATAREVTLKREKLLRTRQEGYHPLQEVRPLDRANLL